MPTYSSLYFLSPTGPQDCKNESSLVWTAQVMNVSQVGTLISMKTIVTWGYENDLEIRAYAAGIVEMLSHEVCSLALRLKAWGNDEVEYEEW